MSASRPSRRLVALLASVLTATLLVGCGVVVDRARTAGQSAMAVALRSEPQYSGARVLDDDREHSLVVVPKHPNGGLVVFLHGWGQTRWSLLANRKQAAVAHALTTAGFTLLAADAGGKAWGDRASVEDYTRLIEVSSRRYGLRDVFLMGESMGGLATMQLARRLPAVRAVTAWFPVCDLRTMREQRFQATIRAAWRGRDRAPVSPVRVGAAPMLVWASPHDTVVRASRNAAVCVAEARAAGAQVGFVRSSGDHGDPSNYDPVAVTAFFERHRSPGA